MNGAQFIIPWAKNNFAHISVRDTQRVNFGGYTYVFRVKESNKSSINKVNFPQNSKIHFLLAKALAKGGKRSIKGKKCFF